MSSCRLRRLSGQALLAAAGLLGVHVALPAQVTPAPRSVDRVASVDTGRRAQAVVVTRWHERRLTIHRWTAYSVPPLFLVQAALGQRLYDGASGRAEVQSWVRPAHRVGASLIATAFATNVTTGIWNLWASRGEQEGRGIRIAHGASMMAAAGGFTYAGVKLAEDARSSADARSRHRNVAIGSMALTLASGAAMWWVNR